MASAAFKSRGGTAGPTARRVGNVGVTQTSYRTSNTYTARAHAACNYGEASTPISLWLLPVAVVKLPHPANQHVLCPTATSTHAHITLAHLRLEVQQHHAALNPERPRSHYGPAGAARALRGGDILGIQGVLGVRGWMAHRRVKHLGQGRRQRRCEAVRRGRGGNKVLVTRGRGGGSSSKSTGKK